VLALDGPAEDWAITAASAGYTAVSVMDLDGSPVGAIRLDALDSGETFVPHAIGGTIVGAAPGAEILIDSYDFATLVPAPTSWSSSYYTGRTAPPPLRLVAYERVEEHLTRIAWGTEMSPRPSTDLTGQDLTFSGAARSPIVTAISLTLPDTAMAQLQSIERHFAEPDGPYQVAGNVLVGGLGTTTAEITIEHFEESPPDVAFVMIDGSTQRFVYVVHEFGGAPVTAAMPAVESGAGIVSTAPAGAFGVADVDALVIHVDETPEHPSRWRIFCAPDHDAGSPCVHPSLPSAVGYDDLQLSDPVAPPALPLLVRMHDGAPWSTPAISRPSQHVAIQIATTYAPFPL
jgi:hypothetical protein